LADDDDRGRFPRNATFTTLALTPLAIEGLTADEAGNLYTTGRDLLADTCPVWKFTGATRTTVGFIPSSAAARCNPSGIAFDAHGDLYIADGGPAATIWRLTPNALTPPIANAFATGVPGTNGLAFDGDGNLWTGDGTTGEGRVWKIAPAGGTCEGTFSGCVEAFRIQPMANVINPLASGVANVGRDVRTLPPGTINAARAATNTAGSQPLVANGLAFTRDGGLYIADTARGAIWKVEFDRRGSIKSKTGCDTTFTVNTLCLDNVFVAHPYLEGTDGIALDRAGNIWVDANERNAVIVVDRHGKEVRELFRNAPDAVTRLRNAGPLEFNTSPFLSGHRFCTTSADTARRDNVPNTAGQVGGPGQGLSKISCMDQRLHAPGATLPVR
jgi:sugar lactone lactonase YvrE